MPLPDREPTGPASDHPLAAYGWTDAVAARFAPHAIAGLAPGRVVRVDRGSALVATPTGDRHAAPATALLGGDPEALPVTGDWVALRAVPGLDHDLVEAVLDRTSAFRRFRGGVQVLAANVDVVFVVVPAGVGDAAGADARRRTAIQADGRVRRLDRELALAYESGARPVVVLSKADLQPDLEHAVTAVRRVAGEAIAVHATSAATGDGVDALRAYATAGRTIALIGASGVGKSTIANALLGADTLATSHARAADQRGRHTTTARHLVLLPGGGALIDTPGIRELGLWDAEEAVDRVYDDVAALAARCRFADCAHEREPGCAVRAAIDDGALEEHRLMSYRKLQREAALEERKHDPRKRAEARQDHKRWSKEVGKRNRAKAKQRWRDG